MNTPEELRKQVEQQARRMKQAEENQPSMMKQTMYLGTLGLLFVVPIVGGAYLGLWLDELTSDYSAYWTLSLILLGVIVGMFNVYYYIKD